jgi:RimJ/RimL family protein N-acetyltransferase
MLLETSVEGWKPRVALNKAVTTDLPCQVTAEHTIPRPMNHKEFLKTLAENSIIWFAIVLKDTGEFLGQCSIGWIEPMNNRDGVLGISMLPRLWGMGYGTEVTTFIVNHAIRVLGLQRVSLDVLGGNETAIALYTKMWGLADLCSAV